ncbi:MAG: NUDIX domain-containing protein [Pseudomonadota bacterium]
MSRPIRIAVRALIVMEARVLLVNAYRNPEMTLLCTPGGGAEPGEALPEALRREVHEETGLTIEPGVLAGVREFHDPGGDFHQVECFFHATTAGPLPDGWRDPAGVVRECRLVARASLSNIAHEPTNLAELAFDRPPAAYHGLVPRRVV